MKYQKNKRAKSLRKQRILGAILIALSLIPLLLEGNATALFIVAPLGLGLIITKDIVVTDDYFYELEAKQFDKWKEP